MKRYLLILFALAISGISYAQQKDYTVHNFEIAGGVGWSDTEYVNSNFFGGTVSYAYSFNKYFGVGGGLSYDRFDLLPLIDGGKPIEYNCNLYSIYGTVRAYVPSYSKYISFVGVVDVGGSSINRSAKDTEGVLYKFPSSAFMCCPQLGIRVKVNKEKRFALNARLYYKYFALPDYLDNLNTVGLLFGVSF